MDTKLSLKRSFLLYITVVVFVVLPLVGVDMLSNWILPLLQ